MNFPKQRHEMSLSEFARKYDISRQTAHKIAKKFGATKTREQYLQDAKTRREIAWNLRQEWLKFKEIADKLGVTINNAQQLVRRYDGV